MANKYIVDLTAAEYDYLYHLIKQGNPAARHVARSHSLLHAAEGATDEEIADLLRVGLSTVHRTRQRFVEEGLCRALTEHRRPGLRPKLDGHQEAFLVALACSAPPAGHARWTMQLLADRLIELQVVEAVSDETVRRLLKKTISNRGSSNGGASPP